MNFAELNKRCYDAYAWAKVALPLNHLSRPVLEAMRNEKLVEVGIKVPALKKTDAEVVGFECRGAVEEWKVTCGGETIFDPDNPKRGAFFCEDGQLRKP